MLRDVFTVVSPAPLIHRLLSVGSLNGYSFPSMLYNIIYVLLNFVNRKCKKNTKNRRPDCFFDTKGCRTRGSPEKSQDYFMEFS